MKILGFDIGVASIGWAYVENDELKDCGVRIFTKAENSTGESLALPRREARSTRRRLTRRKVRLNAIKRLLCKEFGLNLSDYISNDGELAKAYQTNKDTKSPYELRTMALEQRLEPKDLARVILHIAKHRGYGNKHAKESTDDKEEGKVKKAIKANEKAMLDSKGNKKYRSVGEYFYEEFYKKGLNVRNKGGNYEHCVAQSSLKEELALIFEQQRALGFVFSDNTYKSIERNKDNKYKEVDFQTAIMEIAFYQRDLKDFSGKVGKCTFYENEPRAPKDSPSAVEFVALGEIINTLRNLEKQSSKKEYGEVYGKEKVQEILNIILSNGKISYKEMREILDLPKNIHFPKGKNLDYTEGNILTQIRSLLFKISKKVKPKEKVCIYTKDQEIQVYGIVQENGRISYAKLREILKLEASIKFDDTLLGKNKGLDYIKENIEELTFKEIREKNPESSNFISFDKFIAFKEAFEKPKKSKGKSINTNESSESEKSSEVESASGVFANLLQNHRNELDSIAQDIANEKSKDNLRQKLQKYEILKGKDEWLNSLSNLSFSHHINLSFKALNEILPFMREGMRYDEAVKEAGLKEHRKHKQKSDFLPPLEEYEPYLANPVVARALSEYRKVLNALLKKYGKVHKIHIELAREVGKNYATRQKYEKIQKENLRKNNEAKVLLEQYGLPQTPQNILKARLFKEQSEYCAYSVDKKITKEHLLDPKALEIDHIYPYSRSFDDSTMNKVLVFTKENQNKRNKTPFEAFGSDKDKWEKIKSFARNFLPRQKYQRIVNENFAEKQNEFKERNLTDTKYIARLILNYTQNNLNFEPLNENECLINGEKNSSVHCEAVSGTLTTNLRHIWGFENKNRDNHLHHALDAIIIAHINHSMIQRFSEYYKTKNELKIAHHKKQDRLKWQIHNKEISQDEYDKQDEQNTNEYKSKKEELREQIKQKFCLPYGDFRKIVQEKMDKIFVSKPPRKRARGALHEESFGFIDESDNYKIKFKSKDKKIGKTKYNVLDYGGKEGVEKALSLGKIRKIGTKIVKNETIVRLDIFKQTVKGKNEYYAVPIYTMDFALGILPNKAVVSTPTEYKKKNKDIKDWKEMNPDDFCFSLFKDDLILVQKKEMEKPELCYYVSFDTDSSRIIVAKHNGDYDENRMNDNEKKLFSLREQNKKGKKEEIKQEEKERRIIGGRTGIKELKIFEKYQVSPLGEYQKAEFEPRKNISLKTTKKKNGV